MLLGHKRWPNLSIFCARFDLKLDRFILETDDPSGRIIRLTDHPSKYKHKTNFPDELCKCPGKELR